MYCTPGTPPPCLQLSPSCLDGTLTVAFCIHHSQETLFQVRVANKTNEIPVAQAALPRLSWQERVCTADALHTQTALVAAVRAGRRGGAHCERRPTHPGHRSGRPLCRPP